ncbi:MAG: exodeoxyribonuclease VII large subunit [Gammaproteobacteria bacterium]
MQTTEQRDIYSITRLNREVQAVLGDFPPLWVQGEISNLIQPGSGHLYFSLKDRDSQVCCAMFKGRNQLLKFSPENGNEVVVRARVSIYERRGDYQLIVESMEPAGVGALQQAFEQLKRRLQDEGLFAAEHKQPLPAFPVTVGVITSPTGAAIRDILTVLRRRYPRAGVIVYPVQVQGEDAAAQIAAALETANRRRECDVLLLARGGGSLEDLWSFNAEQVARAIYASALPVVTGIGHEIDITIADFAADQRAATPSAAAELITPDSEVLRKRISSLARKLSLRAQQTTQGQRQLLWHLYKRLPRPGRQLQNIAQHGDNLSSRLRQAMHRQLLRRRARLDQAGGELKQYNPLQRLLGYRQRCKLLTRQLYSLVNADLQSQRQRLDHAGHSLNTVSPLATLERGYAIVTDGDGKVIRAAVEVEIGDTISTRLGSGQLQSVVSKKSNETKK